MHRLNFYDLLNAFDITDFELDKIREDLYNSVASDDINGFDKEDIYNCFSNEKIGEMFAETLASTYGYITTDTNAVDFVTIEDYNSLINSFDPFTNPEFLILWYGNLLSDWRNSA